LVESQHMEQQLIWILTNLYFEEVASNTPTKAHFRWKDTLIIIQLSLLQELKNDMAKRSLETMLYS